REGGAIPGGEGLGVRRRGQPDGRLARRGDVRRGADPAHARGDDARQRRSGRPIEPGGRRDRKVRGSAPRPDRGADGGKDTMTQETGPTFATIDEALADIRAGRMVIVVDDADRENEGDFIMAAEKATPENLNFMVTHGRGIVCVPMTAQRLDELRIPLMVSKNNESHGTAFAVSIDIEGRTTTGTSAFDRAATVRAITDPPLRPEDIPMPGPVFPRVGRRGGGLRGAGHTEAPVDLARLAGLYPAGVLCEVLHPDGSMARAPELPRGGEEHGPKIHSH